MARFPILLSIPHGGMKNPVELEHNITLTKKDLFEDSDSYTNSIYDLTGKVNAVVKSEIARAFIDLNRAPFDLPPLNTDGVIKSATCYNKQIYDNDVYANNGLVKKLLDKYYYPYFKQIQDHLSTEKIDIALDCHSMASIGPPVSSEPGIKRQPKICLGNSNGKTCPNDIVEKLAECFRTSFSLNVDDVTINDPFSGGYITRTYGMKPIPWIQVEMNRSLYLDERWFDQSNLRMNQSKLKQLNKSFYYALKLLFTNGL
ncbi:N-formylglutamate amidohydrolase [candidate division KSB1 bacterium]